MTTTQINTHAIEKLNLFFDSFGFDIEDFCERYELTSSDRNHFLSYLLSCIYYREFTLTTFEGYSDEFLECFILALLAEVVIEQKMKKLLSRFPPEKRLFIICYCVMYIREGAWAILNILEGLFKKEIEWLNLLRNLRNNYFDVYFLETLLTNSIFKIELILQHLENNAEKQVQEIVNILPDLIEMMIASPVRGFEHIEEFKKKTDPSYVPNEEVIRLRNDATEGQGKLNKLFSPVRELNYSLDEAKEFLKIYGLRGYFLDITLTLDPKVTLLQILKTFFDLFKNPNFIPLEHISRYIRFVHSFCEKLHTFHHEPSTFVSGFERLVYSVATRGDHFPRLPWLPSVMTGLRRLADYLNRKRIPFSLSTIPVVVFDQSEGKQLEKNRSFVKQLEKSAKGLIWHLSKKQTLQLAEKLNISPWVRTSDEGDFGFAGSRNCTMLLAPVIHGAVAKGIKNFEDLMKLDSEKLLAIYQETVFGKSRKDIVIHLGEDDVALHPCNIFSDALWAYNYQALYFSRLSFVVGRNTTFINPFLDLKTIMADPSSVFSSSRWQSSPFTGGMKGQITKPKFCLPMPFGNEELHVQNLLSDYDFFQQSVLHLAGNRFPKNPFPNSSLDGLEKYLKTFIPYSMQISMLTCLVDARNKHGRCILPWNDPEIRSSNKIHSFHDLWSYASDPRVCKELKKRFWHNFYDLFEDLNREDMPIGYDIQALAELDVNLPVPKNLLNYYKSVRKDALFFLEFGQAVRKYHKAGDAQFLEKAKTDTENKRNKKISQLPISKNLMILIQKIEFWNFLTMGDE